MPSKSDDALLAQYDASQASTEEVDLREDACARYSRVGRNMTVHWVLHAICFLILTLALVFQIAEPSLARCWRLYHYYSPADEAVIHTPWVETRFKGSLWHRSPFKGPPTPEVEEAWQSAMKYGMIAVTAEDILQVGHNLTAVQFPPSVGGGYMAATVGTHQLHCLHFIWQDHHRGSFSDVQQKIADLPEMYEQHYEHCVDYIRQGVMCHFDTGIIPYNWVHDHNNPTPNSNTMHKCLDWERLQDWLRSRAVEMPEGFVWRQPDDAVSLEWNL